MNKKKIRKFALIMALSRILCGSTLTNVKADTFQRVFFILDKNNGLKVVDDVDIINFNGNTFVDENEDISIFDQDNTISKQYGGNQFDFKDNFDKLINDPYIWNEMQKCFPEEEFTSHECAMDFYKLYFNTIYECGCGYVAVADNVFHAFEGKEKEFEEIFGYPMYTIDNNGVINFNYEIFILELFNYLVLYPNYSDESKNNIKGMFEKTLAELELERFIHSKEYNIPKKNINELTGEELEEYLEMIRNKEKKYKYLYEKLNNSIDTYNSLGLPLTNTHAKQIKEYLKKYGIDADVYVNFRNNRNYKSGDIVGSYDFSLYKEENGNKYTEMNNIYGHYVYVVSVEDKKVIVSSWGDKYIFDDTNADLSAKLVLKIKN